MRDYDLKVCEEEHRLYDRIISFEKMVIDVSYLYLRNSEEITFIDCIFIGRLHISKSIPVSCNIFIDNCIFMEEIYISHIDPLSTIILTKVNCPRITIESNNVTDRMYFNSCRAVEFRLLNNKSDALEAHTCDFTTVAISENQFDEVSFPYDQVNDQKVNCDKQALKDEISKFNCFTFREDIDYDKLSKAGKVKVQKDSLEFLLKHSGVDVDKEVKSHLRYLDAVLSQESHFMKFICWALGGLLKPLRVFIIIVLTLAVFTLIYQCPGLEFKMGAGPRELTFGEAVYYSGITFTTIGYGDISPVGLARYIAILQGLIGILLSSAFLTSLIRKYTE